MQNIFFQVPAVEKKHHKGLFGPYFDYYLRWMQERGYSRNSIRVNIEKVSRFGQYLKRRCIHAINQLEGAMGQKLLADYGKYCRKYHKNNSGLQIYIRILQESGAITRPNNQLFEIKQYEHYLKTQKGLNDITICGYSYWVDKFLRFIKYQNEISIPSFGISEVDKFIIQESIRLKNTSKRMVASAIRSFLRYLYLSGKLNSDLSILISYPRQYKFQSLPRVLSQYEIQKILNSIDRRTKLGLRDYAILILLTTYGLRAGEVIRLKLEDIDWRNETIHISPRKTGKDLWLPLIPQVGNAILKYLKYSRPNSSFRELFFRAIAPKTALTKSAVSCMVRRHINKIGLKVPEQGSRILRHSFATCLIRNGASLKQIADLLGHRNLDSTHIYTKTATEKLREIALDIPGVKK